VTIGLRTNIHVRNGGSTGITARACKASKRGLALCYLLLS